METTHQFTAAELYAYQAKAAQAYSNLVIPDIKLIGEQITLKASSGEKSTPNQLDRPIE